MIGQLLILPIAIFTMPIGALLRMLAGMWGGRPRTAALGFGAGVGLLGWAAVALDSDLSNGQLFWSGLLSIAAGLAGGLTWFAFEQPSTQDVIR